MLIHSNFTHWEKVTQIWIQMDEISVRNDICNGDCYRAAVLLYLSVLEYVGVLITEGIRKLHNITVQSIKTKLNNPHTISDAVIP